MMIYITTTGELVKNQKLLASLPASDLLYILYTEKNASIPIEAYEILSKLKCKVQFEQYSGKIEDQLKFVFNLGVLCGENKNAGVRTLTSENFIFTSLFQKDKQPKKRTATAKTPKTDDEKPVDKPAEPSPAKNVEEEFMPAPEIAVQKNTEDPTTPEPEKKKKRGRKSKQDEAFDKAYDELIGLFEKVKTKTFDPTSQLYGIVKAVKASITEKTSLGDSFAVWFPNNSNKYIKAFAGNEDELIRIVSELNDEVN